MHVPCCYMHEKRYRSKFPECPDTPKPLNPTSPSAEPLSPQPSALNLDLHFRHSGSSLFNRRSFFSERGVRRGVSFSLAGCHSLLSRPKPDRFGVSGLGFWGVQSRELKLRGEAGMRASALQPPLQKRVCVVLRVQRPNPEKGSFSHILVKYTTLSDALF